MGNDIQPIEFTTANGGHKVVLKPFITGFDKRAFTHSLYDAPEDMSKTQRAALWDDARLKSVVISIDGATEDLANHALGLDARDYSEICEKVDEIIGDKKKAVTSQSN